MSIGSAGRQTLGMGSTSRSAPASQWYRGVTPHVPPEDRHHPSEWRRVYDNRFMSTSTNRWQEHIADHVEQCHRTHAEKQEFFQQHCLPNLTWMDLGSLAHDRSLRQRQPAYFGDVGGPQREGVMPRLQ